MPPNPNEVETAASMRAGVALPQQPKVDRRIRHLQVAGARQHLAIEAMRGDGGLERARRAERVPVQALRARHGKPVGRRAEGGADRMRLGRLVQRRAGPVGIQVADALRRECRHRPARPGWRAPRRGHRALARSCGRRRCWRRTRRSRPRSALRAAAQRRAPRAPAPRHPRPSRSRRGRDRRDARHAPARRCAARGPGSWRRRRR